MSILSSLINKFTPVKVVTSSQFVNSMNQNFSEIENIKTRFTEKNESSEEKFNTLLDGAIDMFMLFASDPENRSKELRTSVQMFTETFKIKKNKVEPYFYLSYIAYLTGDMRLAIKYFQIAQLIEHDFPGLAKLQEQINQAIT